MKIKYLPLILSAVLVAGIFLGRNSDQFTLNGSRKYLDSEIGSLQQLVSIIGQEYVDSISTEQLEEEAIEFTLSNLDPHSYYIKPRKVEGINESMKGNFSGIGIQYRVINDTVTVISTIHGGPSEKAGLQMGDQIISIDGNQLNLEGEEKADLIRSLRGPLGSIVTLEIFNPYSQQTKEIKIERGEIPITSIAGSYLIHPKKLIVKIERFSDETYSEFLNELELHPEIEELIIDLRNNGGGKLMSAVNIAKLFLRQGDLITYTKGSNQERNDYACQSDGPYKDLELKILINENSASASEILAGAIQDHKRGGIIGGNSFGKGLVQNQFQLPNGGAFRLVIAKYYTPSGKCIQRPYKNVKESEYYVQNLDSIEYGIQPDLTISEDTSYHYDQISDLYNQQTINSIFQYSCRYHDLLKSYSLDDLIHQQEKITLDLIPEGKTLNRKDFEFLSNIVIGDIAQYIWGDSKESHVSMLSDPIMEYFNN